MIVTDPILIELLNNHVTHEVAICVRHIFEPEKYGYPFISKWYQGGMAFEGDLSILYLPSNKIIRWRKIVVYRGSGKTERI